MTTVSDAIQGQLYPFKGALPGSLLSCGISNTLTPHFRTLPSVRTQLDQVLGAVRPCLPAANTLCPSSGWRLLIFCFLSLWVTVSAWAAPRRKGSQWQSLLGSVPRTPRQFGSGGEIGGRFHSGARERQMLHRSAQLLTAADVPVWVHGQQGPRCC